MPLLYLWLISLHRERRLSLGARQEAPEGFPCQLLLESLRYRLCQAKVGLLLEDKRVGRGGMRRVQEVKGRV